MAYQLLVTLILHGERHDSITMTTISYQYEEWAEEAYAELNSRDVNYYHANRRVERLYKRSECRDKL